MWKQFAKKQIILSHEYTEPGELSLDDFDADKANDKCKVKGTEESTIDENEKDNDWSRYILHHLPL